MHRFHWPDDGDKEKHLSHIQVEKNPRVLGREERNSLEKGFLSSVTSKFVSLPRGSLCGWVVVIEEKRREPSHHINYCSFQSEATAEHTKKKKNKTPLRTKAHSDVACRNLPSKLSQEQQYLWGWIHLRMKSQY